MDMATMLQKGPPPDAGGPPPPGDDMPRGGDGPMPLEAAIQVMEKAGITPDTFPMIAKAVVAIIQAQGQGGGDQGEAPPPGPGGPPPGA